MGIYRYMYLFSERISVDFNESLLFFDFLKDSLWINISIIKANLVLEVAPDFVFSFLFIFVRDNVHFFILMLQFVLQFEFCWDFSVLWAFFFSF